MHYSIAPDIIKNDVIKLVSNDLAICYGTPFNSLESYSLYACMHARTHAHIALITNFSSENRLFVAMYRHSRLDTGHCSVNAIYHKLESHCFSLFRLQLFAQKARMVIAELAVYWMGCQMSTA